MAFGNLTDQLAILKRQDLTPTEKFVAVVALSFRNAESGRCNPAIISDDTGKETLCSRSGYTKQCVTRTLRSLAEKGVISLKKTIARPSEITFTVNDVYGKQGLPSTTITDTVNDVYGKGKQRLPITDKEQINEQTNLSVDDSPFSLSAEPMAPPPAVEPVQIEAKTPSVGDLSPAAKMARKPKHKAVTNVFDLAELPDEWRTLCEEIRPDLDPARVFTEFKFYWTQGRGQGTRRSGKGWTTTWMNWIKRQKEQRVQRPTYYPTSKAPVPEIPFEERDYGEGINDDHSF